MSTIIYCVLCILFGFIIAWIASKRFTQKNTNNPSTITSQLDQERLKQKDNSLKHLLNLIITSAQSYTKQGTTSINTISENCSDSANNVANDLNVISTILAKQQEQVSTIHSMTDSTQSSVSSGNQNIEQVQTALEAFTQTQFTLTTIDTQLSQIHEQSLEIEKIGKEAEMLALNAAIESARAGEYGRGFAVVADNMKILAKNSQSTSLEISHTLQNNRDNISNIVKQLEKESNILNTQLKDLFSIFSTINTNILEIRNRVGDFEHETQQGNLIAQKLSQTTSTSMESIIEQLANLAGQISGHSVTNLTPTEVKSDLSRFDEIIDVRREDEFNGDLGHIQNAKLITLQTDLKDAIKHFDKSKKYLFVCRSGGRSAKGAQLALSYGIENVFNMTGGMLEWGK
ncbi:methyl-accepting chemotaxis protein [Marinicellulosiphila megalodicopiae]|uniref:methyl-accepting chemotaxis protein n=1 Tax=Marinicellulosiphila megalodicopiae TaxID=2724896 RepID=UPI003BB04F39